MTKVVRRSKKSRVRGRFYFCRLLQVVEAYTGGDDQASLQVVSNGTNRRREMRESNSD